MCDYSLHLVANRPAKIEDKLVTTKFNNSITRGFAAVGQPNVAVCLLPGTEIAFAENVECEPSFGIGILSNKKNRAATRALPANQYGQSRDPSRCAGISRRAGRTSHALVRWPARHGAATTRRHACRDRGGSGRRAAASRALTFDLIAQTDTSLTSAIRRATAQPVARQGRVLDNFFHFPRIDDWFIDRV
jgi:hypothetical protein